MTVNTPLKETLKTVFGFDRFRENQEEIVAATLGGRDVFTIMPTGGGKSLCYQLPALMMDGVCVVVSPLIALMKDQVDGATANGIRAAYINSSLGSDEKSAVMQHLNDGALDLLYVAPERLSLSTFWNYLKSIKIAAFAIDEAHCISEWGHDFRPDYLVLARLKTEFPHVPVAAFTASATDVVQQDILSRLRLNEPLFVKASFDRPNLFYQVERKQKVNDQIIDFILARPDESGIIYRATRRDVDGTAAFLKKNGVNAIPYHAGMESEDRKCNQERFNRDEVQVIVATVAFGMGIDKSNIRFVIHGDLPKSLEGYYQETGRSGRDGEDAHCLLLYSMKDEDTQNYFINQVEDPDERQRNYEKRATMLSFARNEKCRRTTLLNYFGESYPRENCATCDVCTDRGETMDAARDAQILMSAIIRTNERFGINHVIDVVRGANTQKIRNFNHQSIKTYGAGGHFSKSEWIAVYERLLAEDAIRRMTQDNNRVVVTPRGKEILHGRQPFAMRKPKAETRTATATIAYDTELFGELRARRKEVAEDRKVPPYVIFSDKTLHEMARFYPVNDADFLRISGVGQRKLDDFGTLFMASINDYLTRFPDTDVKKYGEITAAAAKPRYKKATNPSLYADSVKWVNAGMTLDAVAKKLDRSPGTIASHLEKALDNDETVQFDHLITTPHRAKAERAFEEVGGTSLGPIFQHLNETVSYDQLRLIRMSVTPRGDTKPE